MKITNALGATPEVTVSGTANVHAVPLNLLGGFCLGAIVNQQCTATLATLTDPNPFANASDCTASIDWGDGSSSSVTAAPVGLGAFSFVGSHTFTTVGNFTATVHVSAPNGATASASSVIEVADVYAGVPAALTLSSFTVADPTATASEFAAMIDWGDGSSPSPGLVVQAGSSFTIQGSHRYKSDSDNMPNGAYLVHISVNDLDGASKSSSAQVKVVRPPLSLKTQDIGTNPALATQPLLLGVFTVPDASVPASYFSASVDWGDDTPIDTSAQITGSTGMFEVWGSHDYAEAGNFLVALNVSQAWHQQDLAVRGFLGAGRGFNAPVQLDRLSYTGGTQLVDDGTRMAYGPAQFGNDLKNQRLGWSFPYAYAEESSLGVDARLVLFGRPRGIPATIAVTPDLSLFGDSIGGKGTDVIKGAGATLMLPVKNGVVTYASPNLWTLPPLDADTVLSIRWMVSLDGGKTSFSAGESKNEIFLTWAKAKGAPKGVALTNLETVYALGCQGPATNDPEVIGQRIVGAFDGQAVARATDYYDNMGKISAQKGHIIDHRPLRYYGDWNTKNYSYPDLIASGGPAGAKNAVANGQCGAFTSLMVAMIWAQGVNGYWGDEYYLRIQSKHANEWMAVKNWTFKAAGLNHQGPYVFTNYYKGGSNKFYDSSKYTWTQTEANRQPGVPGRNNGTPLSIFRNHQVLEIVWKDAVGKVIGVGLFDPSYGTEYRMPAANAKQGLAQALLAFQRGALAAFCQIFPDLGGKGVFGMGFEPVAAMGNLELTGNNPSAL